MLNHKYDKVIHDQLHGSIKLTEFERTIIDHSLFQRLRYIRQLGLANFVYPGAEHTRFAHSLGTMYIADRIARQLVENPLEEKAYLDPDDVALIRIGALLHDIGHYPLSHALEKLLLDEKTERKKEIDHVELGKKMILTTSLKDTIQDSPFNPQEIVDLIQHKTDPAKWQILSSSLDADRLDFLLRDSINTGVEYGRIDLDRIIDSLVIFDPQSDLLDKHLAARNKAKTALENYLLAHFFMYNTVYRHHSINAFELMAKKVFQSFQKKGIFPKTLQEAEEKYNDDLETFLVHFTDNYFLSQLPIFAKKEIDDLGCHLAYRIVHRKPLKIVKEINEITEWKNFYQVFPKFETKIEQSNDEDAKWCFCQRSKKIQIGDLKKAKGEESIQQVLHIIEKKDGRYESVPLCNVTTSFLSLIDDFKVELHRIYTIDKFYTKIKQRVDQAFE